MGHVIERRARSRKARSGLRALLGRAPAPAEVRDRLGRLLPRIWKGDVDTRRLAARLHPFAPPVRFAVEDDGALLVSADDGGVGPGFQLEAYARIAPLLDELEYVWDAEIDPQALALAWLAGELRAGATRIAMPEGRTFLVDGVQTPLGPRDAAWRDAVLADPAAGRDAFAWWERGPGQLSRSRALLAMWHEVPWREPFDKHEHAVMEQVEVDLRAAREAGLEVPEADCAELSSHLGDAAKATGTIGYRRHRMVVPLLHGWEITLPGAFAGAWEDHGQRYWASDGARIVEVTMLETTQTDSAALLEVAPPRHPVIERAADGARHARAEAYDEDDVHVVHGLVAIAPHVAIVTCKGSAADELWALATWRSVRRAA